MKLTPAQRKIAEDRHRFRVVCAGRRTGKTILAVEEIIANAVFKESRCAYIAPTYQQARDIAWEQLKKRTEGIATTVNESRLEIKTRNNEETESIIQLRGWESIETLRGQKFDFIVIDEVAMMRNFWGMWEEVIRPTLTDTRGEVLFISTPKGFNHFYDLYNREREDDSFKSFHFTTYDNPFIPVDEIDEAKNQLTEDRFYQEYMADFRKQEGLVYKEFQRGLHLFKGDAIDTAETLVGVDFGFTNPTGVLTIKRDRDNVYWVTDELYKTEMTDEAVGEYISSIPHQKCYPDPASPSAIKVLKDKRVNIIEVNKGADSVANGINKVRELFKQRRLRIHEDCKNLIWEIETYSYAEKKSDKNAPEVPIKESDHLCDALRYVLMTNTPQTRNLSAQRHRMWEKQRRNQTNQAK